MSTRIDAELLQRLVDHNDITDLVYRLGVCLDEGRFDEMHSLFVEEATARTPGGTAEGREAVIAQASRNHRPDEPIQHFVTNLLVDLAGDRAEVRANFVGHFASPTDDRDSPLAAPIASSLGAVYRFGVVRTSDRWRITRVEASPVWMSGSLDRSPQPG